MKNFLKEFKTFALKGNVLDLAVGVIIGAAFQGIVKSLVSDIISPLIGLIAKKDFSDLVLNIFGVNIKYGSFITSIINFIIMALVIFLIVKLMNKVTGLYDKTNKNLDKEINTKKCIYCCTDISIKATRCPNCTSILENN